MTRSPCGALRSRRGAALAGVVLLSLVLYGLAHTLLLAARSVHQTAVLHGIDVGLRAAADGVVAETLRDGPGPLGSTLPIRGHNTLRIHRFEHPIDRTLLRLSPETWLVEAEARDTRGAVFTSRIVARTADPSALVAAWPYVVGVGSLDSVDARGAVSGDAPSFAEVDSVDLGPIPFAHLLAASPPLPAVIEPAAVRSGGGCVETAANWGAPPQAASMEPDADTGGTPGGATPDPTPDPPPDPCANRHVLRAARGDLVVRNGEGRGTLVVDGDLTLESVHFRGVVLVTGRLRLTRGADIVGRVIALRSLVTEPGTTLTGSAVVAEEALRITLPRRPAMWPAHPARSLGPW